MKFVLLTLVLLGGCTDKGKCLSWHEETWLQPQYMMTCNGASCTQQLIAMQPMTDDVCDKWEFPNGKPEGK